MGLDDAWKTETKLMDSNVNVLIITMENIVNTKNTVRTINILTTGIRGTIQLGHEARPQKILKMYISEIAFATF